MEVKIMAFKRYENILDKIERDLAAQVKIDQDFRKVEEDIIETD